MAHTIYIIILAIILLSFLIERVLDYLNLKYTVNELPGEVSDVFDREKYEKSQAYKRENTRFSFYSSTFSTLIMILAVVLGLFGWLDNLLTDITESYFLLVLLFFGILSLASDILNTPFDLYDTFKIEEKYGFNKTTPRIYLADKLKGYLIGIIMGGGILLLITWFYQLTGEYFWLLAWGAITFFSIFMNMFYSNLIVPLFNKQKALEEGELRDKIEAFADSVGYKLKNIYVIDGSKRSTKANAYFTGLGYKKRIVLYDTLIKDLEIDEIIAVLAHEIGHYKRKHTLSSLISGIIQNGVMLYLFSLLVSVPEVSQALGGSEASFHIGLIAFSMLYSPISMLIGLIMNVFSRKHEFQADAFAKTHHDAEALIRSLKKLSRNNLSNLTPHPAYVFFHYSHPTLLQRIRKMKDE